MRTDPRPTLKTIEYYYPPDYSPHLRPVTNEPQLRDHIAALAHRLLNAWRIPDLPPGRLLEFGCGPGGYMVWMKHKGWNVAGIESSTAAANIARAHGMVVHLGPLETAPNPEKPFDLCAGWMTIEHLHDPVTALRKLASWTCSKGWLAISLPNAASQEFKLFGSSWYPLQLPIHLYHFTPKTIEMVLTRTGWNLRHLYHQRNVDNLIASCGYILENAGSSRVLQNIGRQLVGFPTNVLLHFLMYPLLFPIACVLAAFGQTGSMTVLAQKAD